VQELQAAIQDDLGQLEAAVDAEISGLSFHHADDYYEVGSSFDMQSATVHDVTIVAIGDNEATVTFEAEFAVKFDLDWWQPDEEGDERFRERVEEDVSVSGTAKVAFNGAGRFESVPYVQLDQDDVELRRKPLGHPDF
jgi:hypothetical protein